MFQQTVQILLICHMMCRFIWIFTVCKEFSVNNGYMLHLIIIPTLFLKSIGDIVIASVRPSVCPSVRPSSYLLLNRWTKSNQIWCVSCSHEWGTQRYFFPRPLGPWGEDKRSNITQYHLSSITKSISKFFKPNFVCLLRNESYKTGREFYLASWVMPQGWDLEVPWGVGE